MPFTPRAGLPRRAVVDLGSNSVRLVIYESFSRTPAVIHNEKAICAIGRDMVTRRRLHDEGMRLALDSLARFRILADAHHVELRDAVATAAARLLLALAFRSSHFLPISTRPSLIVLAFAFGLALLTGIIFGAAPAWFATRTDPVEALRYE